MNKSPRVLTIPAGTGNGAASEEATEQALALFGAMKSAYIPVVTEDGFAAGYFYLVPNSNAVNRERAFGDDYWTIAYREGGEEWSRAWGNSAAQWYGSLLPRIANCLPAGHLLEIAPGQGRWSRFLIPESDRYTGVDIGEYAIDSCRKRFAAETHASFFVNDGLTFPMLEDKSCDFIFSFDSLVHVDLTVMESYIRECLRVLKPGCVAFLHHSNAGIAAEGSEARRTAERAYWALDVTAEKVRASVEKNGGAPLLQECVSRMGDAGIACITVFGGAELRGNGCRVIDNPRFMLEAELIRNTTAVYWETGPGREQARLRL